LAYTRQHSDPFRSKNFPDQGKLKFRGNLNHLNNELGKLDDTNTIQSLDENKANKNTS